MSSSDRKKAEMEEDIEDAETEEDEEEEEWPGTWSKQYPGFPWYMDEEEAAQQAELLRDPLDKGVDTSSFTPDAPVLYKQSEHYVLVYGTLKKNKINHRLLNNEATAKFVADCFTANDHFIMKETRGGIPAVFHVYQDGVSSKEGKQIKCELYLVRTDLLKQLDIFEQNGVVYRRIKVGACIPNGDQEIIIGAWMYVGMPKAFSDVTSMLKVCPHFTRRRKKGGDKEFYTYIGSRPV
jgi:gamma-glutamylcyclotransferase (GGCT)/AIG2-like uncharacterized protein YtfP